MSKYTTEVRFICETQAGLSESKGYNNINTILDACAGNIFNFDYPIFDEAYRRLLEKKILKHYYTREIACETVGLWKHFLDMKMNEIMPYYNKLYETELLEFNPLYDVNLTTTYNKTGTDAGDVNFDKTVDVTTDETHDYTITDSGSITDDGRNGNTRTDNLRHDIDIAKVHDLTKTETYDGTDTTSTQDEPIKTTWDIYSDTPQGSLTNVNNETYLTNARKITETGVGSNKDETITYDKTITTTDDGRISDVGYETNSGTVTDVGTNYNEKTLDTSKRNAGSSNVTDGTVEGSTTHHDIATTEDYLQTVIGKTGGVSYTSLIKEYRDSFINIDMMVIDELSDLFFNLW